MKRPVLYLMLGYPGAGKTTASRELANLTRAKHIWADHERRSMFANPTHSKAESDQLYATLNKRTDKLLAEGKSVIFDTSFNHYADRVLLRSIAARHNAPVLLMWLNTPRHIAKARATHDDHAAHNNYEQTMTSEEWERIASHLEPPHADEQTLEIDGAAFDAKALETALQTKGLL